MLNISEILDRSTEKWPGKVFINFNDREITFRSFREEVLKWVSYLREAGIKSGDIISVFSKNRPEMLELWMASNRIGAIFSPSHYHLLHNP